jgi:hypothetical protein
MNSPIATMQAPSDFKRRFINFIFLLNLFPFFKFIPFITAEVQPVSGLFGGIFLLLFQQNENKRYHRWANPYFFILASYFLMSLGLAYYGEVSLAKSIESLAIFLSPLFTFLALLNNLNFVAVSVFRFALYAWAIVSICQQFAPFILNATGVTFVLSLLIPRFSSESLAEWNRGVVAFAPEPSYGAHIILLMFAFAIFLYRQQKINKVELGITSLLTLMMVYTNQSGSMGVILLFFSVFYGIFEGLKGGKATLRVVTISGGLTIMLFTCLEYFPEMRNIRLFDVVGQLLEGASSGGEFDAVAFTNSQGSSRTISVNVGYGSLFQTYGLGTGMGGWSRHFLDVMENIGIKVSEVSFFKHTLKNEIINIKPYAYGALNAFDLGFLGLGSLSLLFVRLILERLKHSRHISAYCLSCLATSLFGIYYNSPSSLPVYWIFLLLFLEGDRVIQDQTEGNENLKHHLEAAPLI